MLIAIPNCHGRVSPVFDTASRLLLVRWQRGRETARQELVLDAGGMDSLVRSIAELHLNVLLCAAISGPLRLALERAGVRVEAHLCGEVEELVAAYCSGCFRRSEFRMPGCWEGHVSVIPARRRSGLSDRRSVRAKAVR